MVQDWLPLKNGNGNLEEREFPHYVFLHCFDFFLKPETCKVKKKMDCSPSLLSFRKDLYVLLVCALNSIE